MLSKNNYQERLRKMERKQERFSIRKFSVGAASVLIGVLFFMNEGPTNHVVHASEFGQNVTVKSDTGNASARNEVTQPKTETPAQTASNQVANKQEATPASVAPAEAVKSNTTNSAAANKDQQITNTLTVNTKDLANNKGSLNALIRESKVATPAATDEHTADVDNFADLSRAIANKDINTINLTKDIDLTNMTEEQSQVTGGLVSGGTGLTGDNWLQPYELAANKNSNSPYTNIARDLTVNGNDHTINTGKWFISLWNQNQDGNAGWHLTFNDMTVKNNATSTRYTPIYFGNMNSQNLKKVSLTFNNFTADLNTPLTNDEDGVDVIFKGKDVINVSPLANNFSGSIEQGADRNIIYARNVLIDDNADVSITASMTGSFGIGGATAGVQDEEHNIIKLSPDTSDKNDPAGNMAVGKNAKLTINTNGIDGKGSTTSLRGIVSRNTNGTLTLNEGSTVNMTLGKGHSSAVLLSNLDLKKGSTLNIDTMQDNGGFSQRMSGNMGSDGWIYAPIALGAISFSQTGNARLTVADGATLKMKRGNVKTSTAMIQLGGSTVFGGQAYDLEFADGSTIDIQDASDNEGMTLGVGNIGFPTGKKEAYSPLINIMKTSKVGTIGQVKYLNLQRTNPNGYSVGNLIDAASGLHMNAGKFGGVDIKQWDKGNNNTEPNKTWQVQSFSEEPSGKINAAGMAPVDNNKLNDFLSSVNFVKGTQQRLVMTSMDLEAYNYDARYKDSTAKVGETINIDSPTFYQVGEDGTLTPANPNPDLLDNTATGHPYQLGWAQTGNVTIPQGATIDSATGKITFAANEGQVGTVVNIPVTVTYKDDSIDQVIAPVYVLGNDTTPVWQKDDNGNTTGAVAIQYAAGNLPETTDKSAQVENIADNYKLTYYAVPTKDNPEVTPVDITSYGKVSWAKAPTTVVDTPSDKTTVTAPVSISFAPDSTVVKNGYVKGGTQTVDLNLDLTGATAKDTNLGFSKKSIDNGLTQTQFKRLVDTTALDNAGIDYTLSWAETPTTKAQNTGVVRVTYPSVMQADGSTPAYLDIPVQYKVNDPVQTADDVDVTYPTTAVEANKPATIAPVITDNDGKTVDVPEGTKFAIDGNAPAGATIDPSTGTVTIPATNTTGVTTVPVTVTYPDGSTTQTTVKSVSVATNDDVKNPTSPYDMIKDPANLPAGTKVTWADDNTPAAGDNVPAKVIVTVPGAEPIEVTGTAHYDDNAIYTPQVKNPVQATPESLPDAAAQIMNMDKLPEGTTAAWQDGQQVPVTAGQTIPGTIVVTYPDGTTDTVQTTITTTGITDADQYTPEAVAGLTTEVGKVPDAAKAIANADQMPEGTTYAWTTEPDVSKPGQTTGEVTVTYPDGTTDKVSIPVTVEGADKTALQKAVDEAPTVEKTPAYENGTPEAKKAYDDAVDAGQKVLDDPAATQDQVDKATKAIEDAKKGLDGKADSDTYTPEASNDVKVPVGGQVPDAETTITNAKDMPEGTTYEWTKTPDTSKVGNTTGEVTVTYPDGTTDTVTVPVTVKGADKTDLQKAVDEAPTVEKTPAYENGTPETKKAYDDAVDAGKKVLDNPNATQDQVDKATKAIEDAKKGLDGKITVNPYYPATSSSASEASSAADVAKSNASSAASNASSAASAASSASSAAEKNSAAKSDADKASSAASVASSAAQTASSAASVASSAASDAKDQKSIASEQDSIASSAASAGNSSAASEAQSKASEAAKKASEDADIAKSAASTASDAQSAASSAASTASSAASAAESEASKTPIDVTPYEPAASSSASEASSAASEAKSNADKASSANSDAQSDAAKASSAAEKNSAAKSDADKASSAASVASSAASAASSAASAASSAASDAQDQKSIASEQDSIASSAASAGNSSAASEAQSKASEAAKRASEDADIAKSAASTASDAQSTASSAASTASSAASAAESTASQGSSAAPSSASSDYASEASSAASEAGSHASDASSSSSQASSAASEAKSNADKDPNNSKASSAASTASSAASEASSAASTASSAASAASSAASIASSAQSAASSYASEGNSSAASSAASQASSAASQAKSDDSVASSAASKASSAASTASSAASEASSAASSATSEGSSSANSSAASSAGSEGSSSANSSAASSAGSEGSSSANSSAASSAGSEGSSSANSSAASSAGSEGSSSANSSAASSAGSEGSSSANSSAASSAGSEGSSSANSSAASSAGSEGSSSATPGSSSASSDYASEASSAASEAGSHASDASSSSSNASSSASEAKSNADKDPNNSKASSAASTAASAASEASSASSVASSAASEASSAASVASSAQSAASSYASEGNSSAASSAASQASSAASQAKSDDSVASSAASKASSAASTASSAASEASSAATHTPGSVTPYEPTASSAASEASSAASEAKSDADKTSSANSNAQSSASQASSAAEKNSAAKSAGEKASSAASVASSAASAASSASSVASSAASDAKDQKSIASEQDSIASSAASAGNSSAASEAQSKASEAAKKASEDADIAKSAASVASSAVSTASSASSVASSAASQATSIANTSSAASSDYAHQAHSAASEAESYASDASNASTTTASAANDAKNNEEKHPNNPAIKSAASTASSAANVASSAESVAKSAAQDASSAASVASSAQSAASSYANEGNTSAASSAESVARSAASQAEHDDSVASSAASTASSAASVAESAAAKSDDEAYASRVHNTDNEDNDVVDNVKNSGNTDVNGMNTANAENNGLAANTTAEDLAAKGYVVTVGPDGQILDYYPAADGQGKIIYVDANGNVIKTVKVGNKGNKTKAGNLPQTGAKDNKAGIFGLALASIAGIFGLAADKKRKKND